MTPKDAELSRAMTGLAGEHEQDFGPAMQWLVEHPERARPAVLALVNAGGDDMGTRRGFDVLGRIGNPDDVAVFARLLGAAHGTIAADIAHGLALHPSAAARQALIDAAAAKEPDVARAAVTALGSRKDEAARPALEKLLDTNDAILRYRVVGAVIALGAAPSHAALAHRRSVEKDADVLKLLDQALRAR